MSDKKNIFEYLIPRQVEIKEVEGQFRISYDTKIVLLESTDSSDYNSALILKGDIEDKLGIRLEITRSASEEDVSKVIILDRSDDIKEEEGYSLNISDDKVIVKARTKRGLLYGIATFRQLIALGGALIPACEISDKPVLPNRGFYHDASRGRIQKLSSYKKLADLCSYFKLNQLQLYVEHSFLFKGFSEVCRDDTPLTAEDILELDEYCAKLGIELIPSISTFGHLYKVLRTKTFEELCELDNPRDSEFSFDQRMQHHTLDVTNEKSFEFVKKVLDEFLPLFRSNYVNICADETFDLGKGKSKELADREGVGKVYVDYVNRIMEYCINKGKKPMFWGDIIVGFPEYAKLLPEGVICLNWGYSDCEKEDNTRKLADVPVRQYLCPGVHGWRHFINHFEMAYRNISIMCEYAGKYHAEGLLNTDWGDYGHLQDPLFSIPGLIYGAAFSWSGVNEETEINRQISRLYYGDCEEELMSVARDIGMLEGNSWDQLVQFIELIRNRPAAQEAKEFYGRLKVNEPAENNKRIDEKLDDLRLLITGVNDEGKALINRLLLFAEGQKLMCRALYQLGCKLFDNAQNHDECVRIAAEIETWMYHYKKIWRITSRESELYRVEEIFYQCADILREQNVNLIIK